MCEQSERVVCEQSKRADGVFGVWLTVREVVCEQSERAVGVFCV